MGVTGGIFNIIQRGQIHATASALRANIQNNTKADQTEKSSANPLTWSLKRNESAVAAHWRLLPESAAKNAPSLDTVKRLETMAASDNSDIAAEKMRQAKSKLDGLRRQLQMLAASGDVRQLRRIAAEAASLAREIGVAARSIAQGIGAGNVSSDASSAQATASAANAAAQSATGGGDAVETAAAERAGAEPSPTGDAEPDRGASLEQSFKALHDLGTDARNAVVQAKGIIALAAQMARAKRRGASDDDDDRYFRSLQEQADAALNEIDEGQREALGQLIMPEGAPGDGVDSLIYDSVSLEINIQTAVVVDTTQVEVYA